MYKRLLLNKIKKSAKTFPVVLITGARQVGKTTALKQLQSQDNSINYVSLDDPLIRAQAIEDPENFMKLYQPPLIIDEIQYCPDLMIYIKINVDNSQKNGQYYLTGSQTFHSMKGVSESLAGRVSILNLYSLSRREIKGLPSRPFLPKESLYKEESDDEYGVFDDIFLGGMPKLLSENNISIDEYFASYIQTYLDRDINEIIQVQNKLVFQKFLSSMAARTGTELNYTAIANDIGVTTKTVQGWTSLLESSGIIYIVPPYYKNTIKKIIKRSKFYFMDTGLCCYLSMWNNPKALAVSAMAGQMFETYVASEIIKSYTNSGVYPNNRIFYYRDSNGKEIDLLIIENNTVYPIEIKKGANPSKGDIKNFGVLDKFSESIGPGIVLGTNTNPIKLTEDVSASSFTIVGK